MPFSEHSLLGMSSWSCDLNSLGGFTGYLHIQIFCFKLSLLQGLFLVSQRPLHPPSCSSVNLEALLALFLTVLPICPIPSLLPMMEQLLTSLVATALYHTPLNCRPELVKHHIPPFVYIPQPQCAFLKTSVCALQTAFHDLPCTRHKCLTE